jgi:WhiB family redox-sensing transcriptional regulator
MTTTLPPNWNWQDSAACRFTGWVKFYGPDGERAAEREIREREAKEVCATCPVLAECREYALSRPEKHGWWGGLSEDERASEYRKQQRRANDERKAAEREDGEAA